MNHRNTFLLTALVFASATAQAQAPGELPGRASPGIAPTRQFQEPTQTTGTIIKKGLRWNSPIPLNKTYGELTPEQKAELHAMYQQLQPGDEPPFPEKGIKPIFNAISNAQRILQARGELNMVVTVGPDGKATKVEDYSSTYSAQLKETTQQVLLLTKYKPAMCQGAPCTMQYRFTQALKPASGG